MRSHAKASSAGWTQHPVTGLARAATVAVLACLFALAIPSGTAWAAVDTCPNAVFRTGSSAKLPECRAYELVSPPDTGGLPPSSSTFFNQWEMFPHTTITAAGDSLYFQTQGGAIGDSPGTGVNDRYRVRRTADGWVPVSKLAPAARRRTTSNTAVVSRPRLLPTPDPQQPEFDSQRSLPPHASRPPSPS